jgi:hypothetical protein
MEAVRRPIAVIWERLLVDAIGAPVYNARDEHANARPKQGRCVGKSAYVRAPASFIRPILC